MILNRCDECNTPISVACGAFCDTCMAERDRADKDRADNAEWFSGDES